MQEVSSNHLMSDIRMSLACRATVNEMDEKKPKDQIALGKRQPHIFYSLSQERIGTMEM